MNVTWDDFSDKIVLTLTDSSSTALRSIVLVPLANAGPGLSLNRSLDDDEEENAPLQLPLASVQPRVLVGGSADNVEQFWAVHIASAIVRRFPDESRSLVVYFAMGLAIDKIRIVEAIDRVLASRGAA